MYQSVLLQYVKKIFRYHESVYRVIPPGKSFQPAKFITSHAHYGLIKYLDPGIIQGIINIVNNIFFKL